MSLPEADGPRRHGSPAGESSTGPRGSDSGLQWPPSDESLDDLFLFQNEESPSGRKARAPGAATAPAPDGSETERLPSQPAETDDEWYESFQQALGSVRTPDGSAQPRQKEVSDAPPVVQPPLPAPAAPLDGSNPSQRAGLRAHLPAIAVALLALLVIVQALYIFRPGLFRRNEPPASPAAATPVQAAPAPAATVRPHPDEQPTGTSGSAVPAARSGRLTIRSEPSGAAVSIDGRPYGVTPLELSNVRPGDLRVVLRSGGREIRQTVQVEPGATASLIVPMTAAATPAPSPGVGGGAMGSGWVAITSPVELDIMEGDVLVGSTRSPQVMMPAGAHTLRLVSAELGYETTQQVRVEPGRIARVNVTLPQGALHLNAQPWAEVLLDGKPVGETPIGNLPVRIGTHQIVFRHPELGERSVSTVVKPGSASRVAVDLRK